MPDGRKQEPKWCLSFFRLPKFSGRHVDWSDYRLYFRLQRRPVWTLLGTLWILGMD